MTTKPGWFDSIPADAPRGRPYGANDFADEAVPRPYGETDLNYPPQPWINTLWPPPQPPPCIKTALPCPPGHPCQFVLDCCTATRSAILRQLPSAWDQVISRIVTAEPTLMSVMLPVLAAIAGLHWALLLPWFQPNAQAKPAVWPFGPLCHPCPPKPPAGILICQPHAPGNHPAPNHLPTEIGMPAGMSTSMLILLAFSLASCISWKNACAFPVPISCIFALSSCAERLNKALPDVSIASMENSLPTTCFTVPLMSGALWGLWLPWVSFSCAAVVVPFVVHEVVFAELEHQFIQIINTVNIENNQSLWKLVIIQDWSIVNRPYIQNYLKSILRFYL